MLEFKTSAPLTMGVELELQLVNRRDYNLTRAATDLLTRLKPLKHGFDIKPEITESMIEIATAFMTGSAPCALSLMRSAPCCSPMPRK